MVVWQDVLNIAPELSAIANTATQTVCITLAYSQMDAATWGDGLDQAAVWLAAHIATITNRRGKSGAVASQSVGQVAQSFRSLGVQASLLDSTSYGEMYRMLVRNNPACRLPSNSAQANPYLDNTLPWAQSTVYAVGDLVRANGNYYICQSVVGAGESAAAGDGPSGIGFDIPDFQTPNSNGVFWAFVIGMN